ncbi:putative transcriptional regulator [Anaerohalosphaera lusitana]|uniref:Putative transcriptional regulator n=1 Tax=Anaerohalosphaera lusitana TaxID=1936003 RepID=A0A1U9NQP0_9BACT|nr:AlpA family phage regulatory protein [Anaerohalosphaera lusitana]AQT70097.1 putative transcriptional regulator [Anaerohalosphaera lusitana]
MNLQKLINAKQLGELLSLSRRQVFRLNSSGKIPAPLRIGGSVRWNSEEVHAWIDNGAPARQQWEAMRTAGGAVV